MKSKMSLAVLIMFSNELCSRYIYSCSLVSVPVCFHLHNSVGPRYSQV